MGSNDFNSVKAVLSTDFVMEWPQSKERIRGADNFAQMNSDYPTKGQWRFRINRLLAQGNEVVTQVSLTDGEQSAEPVSFSINFVILPCSMVKKDIGSADCSPSVRLTWVTTSLPCASNLLIRNLHWPFVG